jgi:hypothetical protein
MCNFMQELIVLVEKYLNGLLSFKDFVLAHRIVTSSAEFKRLVVQGLVRINDVVSKFEDINNEIVWKDGDIIQIGNFRRFIVRICGSNNGRIEELKNLVVNGKISINKLKEEFYDLSCMAALDIYQVRKFRKRWLIEYEKISDSGKVDGNCNGKVNNNYESDNLKYCL